MSISSDKIFMTNHMIFPELLSIFEFFILQLQVSNIPTYQACSSINNPAQLYGFFSLEHSMYIEIKVFSKI